MKKAIHQPFRRPTAFWNEDRSLSALLILLLLQIFILPLLQQEGHVIFKIVNGLVCSLFLLTGLVAATSSRMARGLLAGLVVAAVTARWLAVTVHSPALLVTDGLLSLGTSLCFTAAVLRKVYAKGVVSAHRVRGAIAAYLLFGYTFATAYRLIHIVCPGSFAINASLMQPGQELAGVFIYFSFVTLTTVGFGDVTAIHPLAKSLVMLEGITGTLYPAILLARLVSLQLEHEKR